MSLPLALGGMRQINQWFVWRMEWSAEEGKYEKWPCALDGSVYKIAAEKPENWNSYDVVAARVAALNATPACADKMLLYTVGFYLTADCGYWFFDLDKCVDAAGNIAPYANELIAPFPGALVEYSASGTGLHVIARTVAKLGSHRSKPKREIVNALMPMQLEFYHSGRGIAFGVTGQAWGSADTTHDVRVAELCAMFFPPRTEAEDGDFDVVRSDWRGPDDDDELIRRALGARRSAEAAFGGKASFAQLWAGDAPKDNSSDMALASHLAFWTGCDAPRMRRLMLRSGLVRDKWQEHRTYLYELTIINACKECKNVYKEPERSQVVRNDMYNTGVVLPPLPSVEGGMPTVVVPTMVISADMSARVNELLDMISGCGTVEDMHNLVIPAIAVAGVPKALHERLVRAINKQLDFWDSKLPVRTLRQLIAPPALQSERMGDAPLWVQKHCYVKDGDYFLDMENGSTLTFQGFQAEYGRMMPLKENGSRENPVEWALNKWHMRTVHHVGYRPDMPPYYEWDSLEYANNYSPLSLPETALQYTEAGIRGIEALQRMMFDMCSRRQDVYLHLLYWLAHNVQKPGVKIRWSPLIKGTQGDGKSIISNVLRSAMGHRNVGVTGNATLTANGGFNDWAIGRAVNVFEEIWLVGKMRHQIYNATKDFITNEIVNVNPKGDKTYVIYNTTNHMAYSNHNDALPLDRDDRRWLIIFTPWATLADMAAVCGLTPAEWKARTDAIDWAWKNCAGELRAWFLSIPIGAPFDKDSSAPETPEKALMKASGQDEAESVAANIILEGAHGVSKEVISSSCLTAILHMRSLTDRFELPRGPALAYMLTRMGYSRIPKQIKWRGQTHTIWIANGFTDDMEIIRSHLDSTGLGLNATQTGTPIVSV